MNALAALAAPHLPVLFGLLLGTLARYGLALDEGTPIEASKVLGHVMMLGLLGLISEVGSDLVAASPSSRALSGAAAALLSAKLVRRYRDWSAREAERRLPLDPPNR